MLRNAASTQCECRNERRGAGRLACVEGHVAVARIDRSAAAIDPMRGIGASARRCTGASHRYGFPAAAEDRTSAPLRSMSTMLAQF
jgi:hypothetical protein